MLTIYRRHRAGCRYKARQGTKCFCPIWIQGVLEGKSVRRSLDLTNLKAAVKRKEELELYGEGRVVSVSDACERFLADVEARNVGPGANGEIQTPHEGIDGRVQFPFGPCALNRRSQEISGRWKLSPISASKKLERLRTFFGFCLSSGWVQSNPAKAIKLGPIRIAPTEPFSESEWERIVWAVDAYGEIHPQTPASTLRQLRALVLLLRYSGLRISDCVSLKRERIDKQGRLFVHAIKNQKPVFLPLPESVLKAIDTCDEENCYVFWSGAGKLKSAITDWQARLKNVSIIAGIEGRGFAHRLRASFSVELLNRGVPLEMVAMILGNTARVVEKHYSMFVQSRQVSLEAAVKATWVI